MEKIEFVYLVWSRDSDVLGVLRSEDDAVIYATVYPNSSWIECRRIINI